MPDLLYRLRSAYDNAGIVCYLYDGGLGLVAGPIEAPIGFWPDSDDDSNCEFIVWAWDQIETRTAWGQTLIDIQKTNDKAMYSFTICDDTDEGTEIFYESGFHATRATCLAEALIKVLGAGVCGGEGMSKPVSTDVTFSRHGMTYQPVPVPINDLDLNEEFMFSVHGEPHPTLWARDFERLEDENGLVVALRTGDASMREGKFSKDTLVHRVKGGESDA